MPIKPLITDFQKECECVLLQSLKELGFEQTGRVVVTGQVARDEEETYIRFDVRSTKVRVFIYDDEAEIESPKFSTTYEHWDFKNPSELIQACNARLRKILTER